MLVIEAIVLNKYSAFPFLTEFQQIQKTNVKQLVTNTVWRVIQDRCEEFWQYCLYFTIKAKMLNFAFKACPSWALLSPMLIGYYCPNYSGLLLVLKGPSSLLFRSLLLLFLLPGMFTALIPPDSPDFTWFFFYSLQISAQELVPKGTFLQFTSLNQIPPLFVLIAPCSFPSYTHYHL